MGVSGRAVQAVVLRAGRHPVCAHSNWTLPEEGLHLFVYYMSTLVNAAEVKY